MSCPAIHTKYRQLCQIISPLSFPTGTHASLAYCLILNILTLKVTSHYHLTIQVNSTHNTTSTHIYNTTQCHSKSWCVKPEICEEDSESFKTTWNLFTSKHFCGFEIKHICGCQQTCISIVYIKCLQSNRFIQD